MTSTTTREAGHSRRQKRRARLAHMRRATWPFVGAVLPLDPGLSETIHDDISTRHRILNSGAAGPSADGPHRHKGLAPMMGFLPTTTLREQETPH